MDWLAQTWEAFVQFFQNIPFEVLGVWTLTTCLLLVGVIGSVVPLLPGPLLLFLAGVIHTFLLPEAGMSWQGIVILALLLVLAYVVDMAAGALGARWFGASRWGISGVFVGGIVGLFFAPLGFILGPLAGGLIFELLFAKKRMAPAVKSTWGTLLGTGAGLIARLFISLLMVATVLVDILWW
ncbi:hypothetical protein SAMN02745166_02905 [Prosthecobacter debontii]|uniref:DUF456 domain-containing protein n=1 Tax=Prosthecobacter debontii TaxID=48467 RepID=A0A1T4YC76_9BACT|nr:DUF456 domain-containing protein [Prosthecobacter debontii]SKA99320.1 hypothetical protein SAMN02745166_02905 [Prosthecobacter debontii]